MDHAPCAAGTNNIPAEYEDICKSGKGHLLPFCSHIHIQGPKCDEFGAHYHEYLEIIYVLDGTFLASVSGQEFSISTGDLLLVHAKEPHAFRLFPLCRYICLQFDPYVLFSTSRTIFEARYIMPFIMSSSSLSNKKPSVKQC